MSERLAGTRILFVMPSIPLGGMERANIKIASLLRESGADVLVATEANFGQRIEAELTALGFRCAPVSAVKNVRERPRFPKGIIGAVLLGRAWMRVALQLVKIYRRYRPTHVYLTSFPYVFYCLPILMFGGARSVLRTPEVPSRTFSALKQRLHDWFWRRIVARLCDVIVCNSEFARIRLQELGIGNVRLIRNCPPYRTTDLRPLAFTFDGGRLHVVYAGAIRPNKGVHLLVEAARSIVRQFQDVDFCIAGPDEWRSDYAEQLRRQIADDGLQERIRFVGDCENVPALFASASLHVCPSIHDDSFPNTILEAKAAGVPSVVFPRGGLTEAIEHRVDGFVCAGEDVESLIEGVTFFLCNRKALEDASRAARQSAMRFSIERARESWQELFAESTAAPVEDGVRPQPRLGIPRHGS